MKANAADYNRGHFNLTDFPTAHCINLYNVLLNGKIMERDLMLQCANEFADLMRAYFEEYDGITISVENACIPSFYKDPKHLFLAHFGVTGYQLSLGNHSETFFESRTPNEVLHYVFDKMKAEKEAKVKGLIE